MTRTRVLGELDEFRLEFLQDLGDAVDVLLHLLVIALIGLGDQLVDLAFGDLVEDTIALADRQQDGVEHCIGAFDDLAIRAREGGDIAAFFELTLARVLGQLDEFGLEFLQHQRDTVDVPLHLLVIALVGLGDQLVDLALGDLVENAIALADRQQNGVEHFVQATQQLHILAAEGSDIGALRQLPAF